MSSRSCSVRLNLQNCIFICHFDFIDLPSRIVLWRDLFIRFTSCQKRLWRATKLSALTLRDYFDNVFVFWLKKVDCVVLSILLDLLLTHRSFVYQSLLCHFGQKILVEMHMPIFCFMISTFFSRDRWFVIVLN